MPVLIVHATERPRLVEIRDNLLARILEAEREGWLGEIEGLQSSLTHAEEKLAQLDEQIARKRKAVDRGDSRLSGNLCSHPHGRHTAGSFVTWTVATSKFNGQRTPAPS